MKQSVYPSSDNLHYPHLIIQFQSYSMRNVYLIRSAEYLGLSFFINAEVPYVFRRIGSISSEYRESSQYSFLFSFSNEPTLTNQTEAHTSQA